MSKQSGNDCKAKPEDAARVCGYNNEQIVIP
jgi:hypothetical protein